MVRLLSQTRSTATQVSLAFGALLLVAFLLVGMQAARWAEDQVVAERARRLHLFAMQLALQLDISMFERRREISNLAASFSQRSLRTRDLRAADTDALRDELARLQDTYPYYAWIGVTDAEGTVLAATSRMLEGATVSARPWWQSARESVFVGDPHEAKLLAKLLPASADGAPLRFLDVAAPIRGKDGSLQGVLGAHLSFDWAVDVQQRMSASFSGEDGVQIAVFDAAGTLQPWSVSKAPHPLRVPVELSDRAGTALKVLASDGKSYLSAAAKSSGYRDFSGMDWTIVVRQPAAVSSAAAATARTKVWMTGLVCAAGLALIGWWLSGRLLRPLRQLALTAQAESPEVQVGLGDDVKRLSAVLRALVERLRARERSLLELNNELETRVAERTRALERRNAELRGMARMVAHDVRAPLGSVVQLLGMAQGAEAGKQSTFIVSAERECTHVYELVDSLLALSVSENQVLVWSDVDMHALAEAAAERQRRATGYDGQVELAVLPTVRGDKVLLGQVWENLIGNAMKFARLTPSPLVGIAARRDQGHWVFSVSDNGVGFDESQKHRLFSAFERLHGSGDGKFPGTGLGLSIVQRVVERHLGSVAATGSPGQGSSFSFTLPIGDD